MNPQTFSILGYLSVVLALSMPLLWLVHAFRRPRKWLCYIALAVGFVAFGLAKVNSLTHVNRIEVDRSEQIAEQQARAEAARKAAADARGKDVAQIRFAEDSAGEFLDAAGMDDADRMYFESIEEGETPAWKQEKKSRSATAMEDDSLEGLVQGEAAETGLESDVLDAEAARDPILMSDAEKALADRLDALHLKTIRWLLLIALGMIVLDYLRRANSPDEAYFPLPLPSRLVDSLGPLPTERALPENRSVVEELAWLVRRGDSFLYLCGESAQADGVPDSLPRLPKGKRPAEVLRVNGSRIVTDDFVFEALWYGRSSFVVDSYERAEAMLQRFLELLAERRMTRARVPQSVHLVWDFNEPLPEALRSRLLDLASVAGVCLVARLV